MSTPAQRTFEPDDPHAAVASVQTWYHTIELAPGVVTPGWFDLRPVLHRMPWPDVVGKRCLDVGTYDGHLAFELERRGASEVVATDISSHLDWDWPLRHRDTTAHQLRLVAGESKGEGFEVAKRMLGSEVEREWLSVYDLDPGRVGRFDVVVCGSLLLHLRDPVRALEAIRSVCEPTGRFMSVEQIDLALTIAHRRKPVARLDGVTDLLLWWTANAAGHRRMLESAGFAIESSSGLFTAPIGSGHPRPRDFSLRRIGRLALGRVVAGGVGLPSVGLLATPDPAVEAALAAN